MSADNAPLGGLIALDTRKPCGVCVLNAVRRGVPFGADPDPSTVIGQEISDGTHVHAAVTTFAGTDVCLYHVDDVAVKAGY